MWAGPVVQGYEVGQGVLRSPFPLGYGPSCIRLAPSRPLLGACEMQGYSTNGSQGAGPGGAGDQVGVRKG